MFLRITTYLPCVLALKYLRKRICIFLIEYNIFLILKISCDHIIEHVNKKAKYIVSLILELQDVPKTQSCWLIVVLLCT